MKKTKVLQVFGSLGMGGAESRMMDVYRNIDRSAYTLDFLTMQDGVQHYESELRESGANVIHVKNPREIGIFQHISELRRVMKEGEYQAVHAHTSYHCGIVLLAARLAGVTVRIAHARTTGSKQQSLKANLSSFLGKFLIRLFSTKRLAISENAGKFLFGNMSFRVVPNTICVEKYTDIDENRILELKEQLHIEKDKFIIGKIGRFDEMKNHRFTLSWFKEYTETHNNVHLVLVGDGELRSEMEALADSLGVSNCVTFTGIRDDVPELIHTFDALIFPSKFEGLGGVVLEAQAAGIPVVESETIPSEADLQIGMVKKCSLEDEFSVWSNAIDGFRGFVAPNKEKIINAFDTKGYSIDAVTETYCQLYAGENL